MIVYQSGGCQYFTKLVQLHGSVFPHVFLIAFPNAAVAAILQWSRANNKPWVNNWLGVDDVTLSNNSLWSTFSFLVGFLVIFRTSQAYARFQEGCEKTYRMRAEWFDACSSTFAFCKHSNVDEELIIDFKRMVVRLFSMLHAVALAEIEDRNHEVNDEDVRAFKFELVDAAGLVEESLLHIENVRNKTELVFQWCQQLIVESIHTGVMSIPPPLLTRTFQQMSDGMVAFTDAVRLSSIPFPFPYAQTADILLIVHWLLVPIASAQWTTSFWWAGIFSFIQTLVLWVLNFIANEMENPFGEDPNDIDLDGLQKDMNHSLMLLLGEEADRTPPLYANSVEVGDTFRAKPIKALASNGSSMHARASLFEVWTTLHGRAHEDNDEDDNIVSPVRSSRESKSSRPSKSSKNSCWTTRSTWICDAPHVSLPSRKSKKTSGVVLQGSFLSNSARSDATAESVEQVPATCKKSQSSSLRIPSCKLTDISEGETIKIGSKKSLNSSDSYDEDATRSTSVRIADTPTDICDVSNPEKPCEILESTGAWEQLAETSFTLSPRQVRVASVEEEEVLIDERSSKRGGVNARSTSTNIGRLPSGSENYSLLPRSGMIDSRRYIRI